MKKIMATMMACLINFNGMSVALAHTPADKAIQLQKISCADIVKNNLKNTKNKVCLAAGSLAFVCAVAVGCNFVTYELSGDKIVDKYLRLIGDEKFICTKVSADKWFEKLGGNIDTCLDEYKKLIENNKYALEFARPFNKDLLKLESEFNQIKKDVDRTNFEHNHSEKFRAILTKILRLSGCEGIEYRQGYNDICALIINKFLKYKTGEITEKDEAKIYYVYQTIIKKIDIEANEYFDLQQQQYLQRHSRFTRIVKNTFKYDDEYTIQIIIFPKLIADCLLQMFSLAQAVTIWDDIIMGISDGEFDAEKAYERILKVFCAGCEQCLKTREERQVINVFSLNFNLKNLMLSFDKE